MLIVPLALALAVAASPGCAGTMSAGVYGPDSRLRVARCAGHRRLRRADLLLRRLLLAVRRRRLVPVELLLRRLDLRATADGAHAHRSPVRVPALPPPRLDPTWSPRRPRPRRASRAGDSPSAGRAPVPGCAPGSARRAPVPGCAPGSARRAPVPGWPPWAPSRWTASARRRSGPTPLTKETVRNQVAAALAATALAWVRARALVMPNVPAPDLRRVGRQFHPAFVLGSRLLRAATRPPARLTTPPSEPSPSSGSESSSAAGSTEPRTTNPATSPPSRNANPR